MKIFIDGADIKNTHDFHKAFSSALGIENYYGENLHALWDVLSASVERPVTLIWKNSDKSKRYLGENFGAIVDVLVRVEKQDEKFGWADRFSFILE